MCNKYVYIYIHLCLVPGLVASHVAGRPKSEQVSSLLIGTLSPTYSGMQGELRCEELRTKEKAQ